MLWASMESLHLACVELRVVLSRWSLRAWQLVSNSTRYPQIMSLNLSKQCFSAANSRMNGMYFSSVDDVHFEENPMGWMVTFSGPLGRIVIDFCVSLQLLL